MNFSGPEFDILMKIKFFYKTITKLQVYFIINLTLTMLVEFELDYSSRHRPAAAVGSRRAARVAITGSTHRHLGFLVRKTF